MMQCICHECDFFPIRLRNNIVKKHHKGNVPFHTLIMSINVSRPHWYVGVLELMNTLSSGDKYQHCLINPLNTQGLIKLTFLCESVSKN